MATKKLTNAEITRRLSILESQIQLFVSRGIHHLSRDLERIQDRRVDVLERLLGDMGDKVRLFTTVVEWRCEKCGARNESPAKEACNDFASLKCSGCQWNQAEDFQRLIRRRASDVFLNLTRGNGGEHKATEDPNQLRPR